MVHTPGVASLESVRGSARLSGNCLILRWQGMYAIFVHQTEHPTVISFPCGRRLSLGTVVYAFTILNELTMYSIISGVHRLQHGVSSLADFVTVYAADPNCGVHGSIMTSPVVISVDSKCCSAVNNVCSAGSL